MCQIGRSLSIQQLAESLIVFSLVNSSIGSTIHDTINLVFIDKLLNSPLIGNIQFSHVSIKICMFCMNLLQQLHLVAQLAITARNQYIHRY